MNQSSLLLRLSLIDGIGPVTIKKIIEADALDHLCQKNARALAEIIDISISLAEKIHAGLQDTILYDKVVEACAQRGIKWCTIADTEYPSILKHTYAPPIVLYWQGTLPAHERLVSIIGSRAATHYSRQAAQSIIPELIQHDYTIVSGGAIGADSIAHEIALKNGGKTVAILGSGLLHLYPSQNKRLFAEIVDKGGAILSPFHPFTIAAKGTFPARNRIISGMSQMVIVLQAAQKSGTMITVSYALEEGRDVGAVPGPIGEPLSAGCNALIKQGGALIETGADVLRALGTPVLTSLQTTNSVADNPLLAACQTPITLDTLMDILGQSREVLLEQLTLLELEGLIYQDHIGQWCRH